MKKVISIRLKLTKDGFSFTETEWNCEEKNVVYILTRGEGNEKSTRHLQKAELFVVNQFLWDTSHIENTIISPVEKLEEAKTMLMESVLREANNLKASLESLFVHIK